ncbi:MAG: ArsR/SmtB family transcription factor [Bernardetiaceae bacterium]
MDIKAIDLVVVTAQDEELARYAKALGHPARIFILRFLEQQCTCFAGDISGQLPMANSTVSQHLKALKEAGLIQGTINPPTIKYCINQQNWQRAKVLFEDFFKH